MINKYQNIPKDTAWITSGCSNDFGSLNESSVFNIKINWTYISTCWKNIYRRSTLFSENQNWSHKTSFFTNLDNN
jgi:hypothetical protein